jgi:hypothetical protein
LKSSSSVRATIRSLPPRPDAGHFCCFFFQTSVGESGDRHHLVPHNCTAPRHVLAPARATSLCPSPAVCATSLCPSQLRVPSRHASWPQCTTLPCSLCRLTLSWCFFLPFFISFFFLLTSSLQCSHYAPSPPSLPMDARPSSPSGAYHGPTTNGDENGTMVMLRMFPLRSPSHTAS